MFNYKLTIEYDGTNFFGWQKQPKMRTVQGELEKAIFRISKIRVKTIAAGRTDAGVSALGQVVNFQSKVNFDVLKLRTAINGVLPRDISIISLVNVPENFNARFCAQKKIYEYRIWNKDYFSVWISHYWYIKKKLDLPAMKKAAAYFEGKHDFTAFASSGGSQEDKQADIDYVKIKEKAGKIIITIKANRFLYKMVRNIIGSLVDVGLGRLKTETLSAILKTKKRPFSIPTAPSKGLFLKKINY